ncbi:chaperone modulator CbpM [Mucilaginibacter litoreus]|uniref:Chaperone modulator CbpM n=1 Tax=Mucilaginibacter litoreus TaxID=1048221 RepID=A0ABW3APF5_9SPHI
MKADQAISVDDFCIYHNVQYTFIDYLADAGLINVTQINKVRCIPLYEIQKLERMVRLHTQLEINEAGIATISNLLERIEGMQQEMKYLRSRLHIYED